MRLRTQTAAALSVAAALGVAGVIARERARSGRAERAAAAMARDSVEAAADSTRLARHFYMEERDSLRLWERRAIQAEQRADALDRALGRERAARADVRVAVPVLDTAVVLVADEQTIRRAPYTVELTRGASADADSVVGVRVSVDTIALGVRIGCAPAARGVRSATVSVAAPAWAAVSLAHVEQEPRVCNPGSADLAERTGLLRRVIGRFGATVGYGAVAMPDGSIRLRPVLGVGIRIWP